MKAKNISSLLGNSINTVANWRKENRPIIDLLEKYFTDSDIEEFIETGAIFRMEALKGMDAHTEYVQIDEVVKTLAGISANSSDHFSKMAVELLKTASLIASLKTSGTAMPLGMRIQEILKAMSIESLIEFYFVSSAVIAKNLTVVPNYIFAHISIKSYLEKNRALMDEFIHRNLQDFLSYVDRGYSPQRSSMQIAAMYKEWSGGKKEILTEPSRLHHLYAEQQFFQVEQIVNTEQQGETR